MTKTVRQAEAIDRYLRTGKCDDINHLQWPGQNIMEKGRNGHDDHVRALVAEVKKRSAPIIDDWIKKASAKGVDARRALDEFHAEIKKLSAKK